MKHIQTFESFLNESKDEIIFTVDDDKLDQMLNARFSRQLDYKDDRGDSYYSLPKREFDQFIDLADSSGFDVDYENSEDSVVYVQESRVNEALKDTREIVGKEMEDIIDALDFLGKSAIGVSALNKACKGKVPYTIFLTDEKGFPKPGGLHSSSVDFISNAGSGMTVSDYVDCVNTVLDDHGYDKFKLKILK